MPRHRHRTVKVKTPYGYTTPIDAELAPLVKLLWAAGIDTEQCCQEEWPGLAAITFPGTGDVMAFLEVAQRPYRVELQTWDEGEGRRLAIAARLLVVFPAADVPRLVQAFARRKGK